MQNFPFNAAALISTQTTLCTKHLGSKDPHSTALSKTNACQGLLLLLFVIELSAGHCWKTHTLLTVRFHEPETRCFSFTITDANLCLGIFRILIVQ